MIGQRGNVGQVVYAATKAGVTGMTRSLAKELASRNITVNTVAPGYIKTPMTDGKAEMNCKPQAKKKILIMVAFAVCASDLLISLILVRLWCVFLFSIVPSVMF